ncbi:MAG: hypothetical protein WKF81_05160 [Thermomicrobiales bacterium]
MTIGIRRVGESRLRWLACDEHFESGERILVDGAPAAVVIGTSQFIKVMTELHTETGSMERIEAVQGESASREADALDSLLALFPQPGSQWTDDNRFGSVTSINLKSETFTVKFDSTGDIVTFPLSQESE